MNNILYISLVQVSNVIWTSPSLKKVNNISSVKKASILEFEKLSNKDILLED